MMESEDEPIFSPILSASVKFSYGASSPSSLIHDIDDGLEVFSSSSSSHFTPSLSSLPLVLIAGSYS